MIAQPPQPAPDPAPQAHHKHVTVIPGHWQCFAYGYTTYQNGVVVRAWIDWHSEWCEIVR